jgi:hypothetical protein
VKVVTLFDGFQCIVMMPFFEPVAKQDRNSALKIIENVLSDSFFKKLVEVQQR